jgi:hypothetical protein
MLLIKKAVSSQLHCFEGLWCLRNLEQAGENSIRSTIPMGGYMVIAGMDDANENHAMTLLLR